MHRYARRQRPQFGRFGRHRYEARRGAGRRTPGSAWRRVAISATRLPSIAAVRARLRRLRLVTGAFVCHEAGRGRFARGGLATARFSQDGRQPLCRGLPGGRVDAGRGPAQARPPRRIRRAAMAATAACGSVTAARCRPPLPQTRSHPRRTPPGAGRSRRRWPPATGARIATPGRGRTAGPARAAR